MNENKNYLLTIFMAVSIETNYEKFSQLQEEFYMYLDRYVHDFAMHTNELYPEQMARIAEFEEQKAAVEVQELDADLLRRCLAADLRSRCTNTDLHHNCMDDDLSDCCIVADLHPDCMDEGDRVLEEQCRKTAIDEETARVKAIEQTLYDERMAVKSADILNYAIMQIANYEYDRDTAIQRCRDEEIFNRQLEAFVIYMANEQRYKRERAVIDYLISLDNAEDWIPSTIRQMDKVAYPSLHFINDFQS